MSVIGRGADSKYCNAPTEELQSITASILSIWCPHHHRSLALSSRNTRHRDWGLCLALQPVQGEHFPATVNLQKHLGKHEAITAPCTRANATLTAQRSLAASLAPMAANFYNENLLMYLSVFTISNIHFWAEWKQKILKIPHCGPTRVQGFPF